MNASMHVEQISRNGCVFACIAMLERFSGVKIEASEKSVRQELGFEDGPAPLNATVKDTLQEVDVESQDALIVAIELLLVEHKALMLTVHPCLSHNMSFAPTSLASGLGRILDFCTPCDDPSKGCLPPCRLPHSIVVCGADSAEDEALVFDPWHPAQKQPITLQIIQLVGHWMGHVFVLS